MQYVWQHRLWLPSDLATVDGEAVEVLDPGLPNHDAGPDFFNAKVRIGRRTWAGNVEIHVRASDWKRHGHSDDRAYDSVILHVVADSDSRISRPDGNIIPQMILRCAEDFSKLYSEMVDSTAHELACFDKIASLQSIYINDWLTALAFERIYAKADRLDAIMKRSGGDWRTALYVLLARSLGFSTNSDAFERLALATPLPNLMRHQRDISAVEAALFGQAGLLENIPDDDSAETAYMRRLRQNYDFMSAKYGWHRPASLGWKMARMRPQNFPHRRIAFLAKVISDGFGMASTLHAVQGIDDARALFSTTLSPFWSTHYTFAPTGERMAPRLARKSVESLIINVAVPAMYLFGARFGTGDMLGTCVDVLQALPPEDNRIVRLFVQAGIECPDAFTSQALIELRRSYCEQRKCLYCRFGHRFLAAKALKRQ